MFVVFFSGCDKAAEEDSIEIMSYDYRWKADKLIADYIMYAEIYKNGNIQLLKKDRYNNNEVTAFMSSVKKETIDSIFMLTSKYDETYYQPVYDTMTINICDSPLIRIRIKTENIKDYSLTFSECDKKKKFTAFNSFYKQLNENKGKQSVGGEQCTLLLQKQKSYQKFVIHRDSTQLPFPPPPPPAPKIDEVKFVKPQYFVN